MAIDVLLALFTGLGILGVLVLWIYYDARDARAAERRRRNGSVYACARCSRLYLGPRSEEARPCPACGFGNGRLRF